ncbi:hypothetical protein [Deinococcus humi]|uniref:Uncharacterized protein n=1 Tax=Deinococcus humi TaxID=662880 RepID=A0A7W8NFR7_9DEIO|nr:hypothetical protein [Deinococcus humi]MBB5364020.1 hypothetical protein [Deinococcus humi]
MTDLPVRFKTSMRWREARRASRGELRNEFDPQTAEVMAGSKQ